MKTLTTRLVTIIRLLARVVVALVSPRLTEIVSEIARRLNPWKRPIRSSVLITEEELAEGEVILKHFWSIDDASGPVAEAMRRDRDRVDRLLAAVRGNDDLERSLNSVGRVRILDYLLETGAPAKRREIAPDMSTTRFHAHMKRLRETGLVDTHGSDRYRTYSISPDHIRSLTALLSDDFMEVA